MLDTLAIFTPTDFRIGFTLSGLTMACYVLFFVRCSWKNNQTSYIFFLRIVQRMIMATVIMLLLIRDRPCTPMYTQHNEPQKKQKKHSTSIFLKFSIERIKEKLMVCMHTTLCSEEHQTAGHFSNSIKTR